MQAIDLAIVDVYLILVIWLGARFSRRQTSIDCYFLARQQVPWSAVMASIVATEASTVTLISVPGYSFGGDFTFLQIALG
jgi:SSS family solute:Na+ symporter